MRSYICIDLKSFYASVECVERGLDPMTTDLVVADPTRTEKTICLAVSPSLKAKGVKNRCRLFEIPKNLKFIIAPPRMQKYINYSARIYGVYIKYISKEDIHVYSVDEAFLDVTDYLKLYKKTPRELAQFLIDEVKRTVGVNATVGIGTNLYLAKIALDILAKHAPDFIGELDEKSYQEKLWDHLPLTDFWRIGKGTARTLEKHCIYTMRDIAKADEDILYGIFGKDAELLIDHAWGREPVTIKDIKAYRPETSSFSSGQVLPRDYSAEETVLIVREMMRDLCLRLTNTGRLASSITLSLGPSMASSLPEGDFKSDLSFRSGLTNGSFRFLSPTNATSIRVPAAEELFWRIADKSQSYRRLFINCNQIIPVSAPHQASLFDLPAEKTDDKFQNAMLDITRRFGKNAIIRGEDLEDHATARERHAQIGGHRSGK